MLNFSNLVRNAGKFVQLNSPVLLTSVAVVGVLSTAVMAVKGTPQALRLIDEAREEKGEDLTKLETVKAAYLCYVPAAAVGAITITAIVSGHAISTRRNAAIMSMYALTDKAYREYREEAITTVGKEKEEHIRANVMKRRMERDPDALNEVVIMDGENKVLMYDTISGRYFKNDVQSVRKAENDLNQIIVTRQHYVSLNEFWSAIGLDRTEFGDSVGWNLDNLIEIRFATQLDSTGEKPVIALDFRTEPNTNYYLNIFD